MISRRIGRLLASAVPVEAQIHGPPLTLERQCNAATTSVGLFVDRQLADLMPVNLSRDVRTKNSASAQSIQLPSHYL